MLVDNFIHRAKSVDNFADEERKKVLKKSKKGLDIFAGLCYTLITVEGDHHRKKGRKRK
jgi:hypothetical protein